MGARGPVGLFGRTSSSPSTLPVCLYGMRCTGRRSPRAADLHVKAKDVVPGVFSRHAAAYRDRLMDAAARGETRSRVRTLELLAVSPGERVLDLGCGPGTLTFQLVEAASDSGLVVGVDLARGMLALARADAAPPPLLVQMDLEQLAFGDGVFDAVASGHSLHFCPDLAAALAEARRVLRQGGRFAASVPLSVPGRSRLLDDLINELAPPVPELADLKTTQELLADVPRLRAALMSAGFRTASVENVEEVASYSSPEELVSKTMSWWAFAWRLESLSEEDQERIQAQALRRLKERVGGGPLEMAGTSIVMFALA